MALADAEAVRSHGDHAMVGTLVRHQLGAADLIVLNKTDLVTAAGRTPFATGSPTWPPARAVVEASHGRVPISLVLAGPDADEPAWLRPPGQAGGPTHEAEFGAG